MSSYPATLVTPHPTRRRRPRSSIPVSVSTPARVLSLFPGIIILSTSSSTPHKHQRHLGFWFSRALHSSTSTHGTTRFIGYIEQDILAFFPIPTLTHHRYPAYCWVSGRRWHSYPIAGRTRSLRSAATPRSRRSPIRSFLCISYPHSHRALLDLTLCHYVSTPCMLSHVNRIAFSPFPSSAICSTRTVVVLGRLRRCTNRRYRRARRKTNIKIAAKPPRLYGRLEGRSALFISLPPGSQWRDDLQWVLPGGLVYVFPSLGWRSPPCVLGFWDSWSCLLLPFSPYRTVAWRPFLFYGVGDMSVMSLLLPFTSICPLLPLRFSFPCTIFMHPSSLLARVAA